MIAKIDEAVLETQRAENVGRKKRDGEELPRYVSIQALCKALPTDAWRPLTDPDSRLSQTLLSEQFKDPRQGETATQIDVLYLKMFSVLHCVTGKKGQIEKARVLYNLLQEGGFDVHKQISATDKDIIPVFKKLCQLATVEIFELSNAFGDVDTVYNEVECEDLVSDDNLEQLREDIWLEFIFGAQSRLENEIWLQKVIEP